MGPISGRVTGRRVGRRTPARPAAALAAALTLATVLPQPVAAGHLPPVDRSGPPPVELDVLFVGAHPDDEAFTLPALGQWQEYDDVVVGVMTVTRGEGGGNAVGQQEGPALGLIREAEERRAVAYAGVADVFYEDKVDFYYTVSAPLTEAFWGHDDALERVVRIVRTTRPKVIATMDPSPTPGNHGHHQYAARLAIEAYYAAADAAAFPEQVTGEGLAPWRVGKLLLSGTALASPGAAAEGLTGLETPLDSSCGGATTDVVYSVPASRFSQRHGKPWGLVLADIAREYPSQGWAAPAFVGLVTAIGPALCNTFRLVDSRVPFTSGATHPTAALEGATYPAEGGLPLGSELYLEVQPLRAVAGSQVTVTAVAAGAGGHDLAGATVALELPDGWTASGDGLLRGPGPRRRAAFTVTVPRSAPVGAVRIGARLSTDDATATTLRLLEVVPPVRGLLRPLPHVQEFRSWARRVGVPQLDRLLIGRQAVRSGGTRELAIELENFTASPQSGEVRVVPPAGFTITPAVTGFRDLAPGATLTLPVSVRNTDPSLATGADGGDYALRVETDSGAGSGVTSAALNLVPATAIPEVATAPVVDGVAGAGEYPGPVLDVSRVWEGTAPASSADASGTARVSRAGEALYLLVEVHDQAKGFVLPPEDCKRHWRTDSVEITLDPRASSENTSTTFKVGILPETQAAGGAGPPCWQRDADHHQGPGARTAPTMDVAAVVSSPYRGYTIEARIGFADLPVEPDPAAVGLNILIYDSDTQDKTGQRRLAWSPWAGVQGDPYRWGRATLPGYPGGARTEPGPVIFDSPPLRSVRSPQSILQAAGNGVALAGEPSAPAAGTAAILAGPNLDPGGGRLEVVLDSTGPGTAHLHVWDGADAILEATEPIARAGAHRISRQLSPEDAERIDGDDLLLVAFEAATAGTRSLVRPLTLGPLEFGATVSRVAGADRVATAAAVSAASWPAAATVVIARADDYPDALAGAPLAARLQAPLLLIAADHVPPAAAAELRRLGARRAVVLGGSAAVGPAAVADLRQRGLAVERIAGPDRFATAAAIARRLGAPDASAIIATGTAGFADALAAAPLAGFTRQPILLVGDTLPAATSAALGDLGVRRTVVAGGPAAVGEDVEAALRTGGHGPRRVSGTDRYATSAALFAAALDAGMDARSIWVATGLDFPDALAAGSAAAGHPLVLVDPADLDRSAATARLLASSEPLEVRLLGGRAAISQRVQAQVRDLVGAQAAPGGGNPMQEPRPGRRSP